MTASAEPLTLDEKDWAFYIATTRFTGARDRWAARAETGLTSEQLEEALKYELGMEGGSCGHDNGIGVCEQGNGLKIWAARGWANKHTLEPMCQGQGTVTFARRVYGIRNHEDKQMGLFG